MKIRNNLSSWLYLFPFFPLIVLGVLGIFNKSVLEAFFCFLLFLFFSFISFIDIKFFRIIRKFILWIFVFFAVITTIPMYWGVNDEYASFLIALFFISIAIILTISEYQWHEKIKQNIKKSIWISALIFLHISVGLYQYIENKKADNLAIYICEKSSKYKNIDELNKVFISEEIMNKLYTKEPRTEQFGDSILFHYYNIRRPWGFFDTALISCEIKTDMQGNILSHEIK